MINVGKNVSKQVSELKAETATQLSSKADSAVTYSKTEVNTELAKKRDKTSLISQTDCTPELIQQIAGTTPVNAIPADKSILTKQLGFTLIGKNIFDKSKVTTGNYVNNTTGNLLVNTNYFASDYILISTSSTYTVSHAGFYALYDEGKVFISGANPGATYQVSTGAARYLRVSTSNDNLDTFQVELGGARTAYESFYEHIPKELLETPIIKSGDIELNAIMPEATKFIKHGKNYYDQTVSTVDKYINHITGTADVNTSYYASDYMIVEPNTSYVQSHGYGIAFYDRNKSFISGITTGSNNRVVTTPSNTVFMRSSVLKTINDVFQIEKGSAATAYESYRLVIDKLNVDANDATKVELILPPKIYGLVGKEVNLYFDNIISASNLNNYQVDVVCTIGKQQNERWTVIPSASGTFSLTVNVYKDYNSLIKTATTSLVVKDAAVGTGVTKKVVIIGDSTTDAGIVTGELLNLFGASDPMDITLLGTRGTGTNKHEGRAGWSAGNYATSASVGGVTNAFWNPTPGAFDFSYYMSQQSYASVDYVGIHIGINDMFGQTGDAGTLSRASITANYIQTMVDSIKAYSASVRIGVMLTIPPSYYQDAFGKDYGSGDTRWRHKRSIDLLVKTLIAQFSGKEGQNVYVVPYNTNLDTVNNMATETVAVNSRNTTTVVRQSNGVHPANSGYYQMADVLYYFIKSFEV